MYTTRASSSSIRPCSLKWGPFFWTGSWRYVFLFISKEYLVLSPDCVFNLMLNSFYAGQWSLYSPPGDILLGSGHLWSLHAHSKRHRQRSAAAHRHNVTLHRLKDRGTSTMTKAEICLNDNTSHLKHHRTFLIKCISVWQEIYPPKLQEFAYVSDGACNEEEILAKELVILKALKWELCPETIISWLKLYSQVDSSKDGANFLIPQFSQETYIQITQVRLQLLWSTHLYRCLLSWCLFWLLNPLCSCWIFAFWTLIVWISSMESSLLLHFVTLLLLKRSIKYQVSFLILDIL